MTKISLNHGNSDKMTTFFLHLFENLKNTEEDIENLVILSFRHPCVLYCAISMLYWMLLFRVNQYGCAVYAVFIYSLL